MVGPVEEFVRVLTIYQVCIQLGAAALRADGRGRLSPRMVGSIQELAGVFSFEGLRGIGHNRQWHTRDPLAGEELRFSAYLD